MKKYNYHTQDFRKIKLFQAILDCEKFLKTGLYPRRRIDTQSGLIYRIDGRAFRGKNVIVETKNGFTPFAVNRIYTVSEYKFSNASNSSWLVVNAGYFQRSFTCLLEERNGKIILSNFRDMMGVVYHPQYRHNEGRKTQKTKEKTQTIKKKTQTTKKKTSNKKIKDLIQMLIKEVDK